MKCPYCGENIEKINVTEGKYIVESEHDTGYEKMHITTAGIFTCPKCETILAINSARMIHT